MEKADRKTRIAVVASMLQARPGQSVSLGIFCDMFGAAKSTMSEDIAILRATLQKYGLGDIEVTLGAGGGVKFVPSYTKKQRADMLAGIAEKLSDPSRILPGGYIYTVDIFTNPVHVFDMANALANVFGKTNADFIATVETKGIPLALGVARALGKPLVIARRDAKITEGSVVTINYLLERLVAPYANDVDEYARRGVRQKALLIDDFIAGGGTVHALCEMMKEFTITVVGIGIAISTRVPEKKKVDNYKSLLTLEEVDEENESIVIRPV